MPAFRLIGAQIRTVRAEMSKGRPKNSPKLTKDQRFWRNEAKRFFELANSHYRQAEDDQYTEEGNPQALRDASANALYAQLDWRKAHPCEDPLIEVVRIDPAQVFASRGKVGPFTEVRSYDQIPVVSL